MKASKFAFSPSWKLSLIDMGIDLLSITTYADLPADLFNRAGYSLSTDEYFRFWNGIERAANEKDVPLLLAQHMTAESFDAPIFASMCSANLNAAVHRLSHYKPLIGPLELDVAIDATKTQLTITCYNSEVPIPRSLGLC